MDPRSYPHDLEAAQAVKHAPSASQGRATALLEASALLVVWSLLVINEGTIRFMGTDRFADLLASGRPPALVAFLAAVLEVVFGIIGLFLGLHGVALKTHSARATRLCMAAQSVLGWYVFIVYVFVLPAFGIVDRTTAITPHLTLDESRAVLVFGILTSASFCLALQGGQFAFMSRVLTAGEHKRTSSRGRALFWNANLALAGAWTVATGAIVLLREGSGLLDAPFKSPPNVGRSAVLTLATGALMFVWGVIGMGMSFTKKLKPARAFVAATGIVYVVMYLNYSIVQLGLIPDGPAGAASLHAGLVFLTVFIGPYFLLKQSEEGRH